VDDVPLRDHLEALIEAQRERVTELALLRKSQVDEQVRALDRRLDESAHDRERIRSSVSQLVPREEYDRTLGLALDRLSALERNVNRLSGGIAVIVLIAGAIGVILRYTVG
jgi:hypothetical protein